MTLRLMCCVAPLALMVGCGDVHGRETALGVAASRGFIVQPSREAPSLPPASLRAAAPSLDAAVVRPQRRAVPGATAAPGSQAAPHKTLALLSAFGAMVLVVSRRLRREP